MKKTLAILLAIILVAVMLPTATFVGAATEEEIAKWDDLFVKSEGVTIDYDACTLTAGSAVTFKATIPAGGFIQFNQKLSDLVPASDAGDMDVQVIPSDLTKSDFFVQLVSDENAKGDILPVDEVGGADPGNSASTVHFYANATGLSMGRGHMNNSDSTQIATFTNDAYWGANLSNGLRLRFYQSGGKILTRAHGTAVNKVSQKTIAELNGEDGFFVRLRTRKVQETYTVTINSSDISDAYYSNGYILSDRASSVDASSIKYSYNGTTGMSTYTADVTLSGNGSYVQFGKKLTDLLTNAQVNITSSTATQFNVQLTDDATALKDIKPIQEKVTEGGQGVEKDPGTDAMTWYFREYSSNIIWGRGNNTAYFGTTAATYSDFTNANTGLNLKFGKDSDNKVSVTTNKNTNYYASYHTAAEVGLSDGGYFRLRHLVPDSSATYTIKITTKATRYQDGAYKFSDEGSKLVSTTRVVEEDKIKETATVKLYPGAYVQLDRKLIDFIPASDDNKLMAQVFPETIQAADFHVQLTADATALTDIVPVNEVGGANPGNLGTSTQFYCNGSALYIARGKLNNNDATDSGVGMGNTGFWANGIRMRFYGDGNGHITTRFHGNGTAAKTSVQTIADLGGQDGLYFRLRNNKSTEHTYTFTVYYKNAFVAEADNGAVTIDKTAALTGETVTATVNAADNYQLKAGSLKYVVDGKEFPITNRVGEETESNTFTFAMPEDAVTVKAEFVKADAVNVALLGAGLNVVDGELGQDMRFGTRAYRKAGDKTLFLCGNYVLHAQSDLGQAITANGGVVSEDLAEQLVSPAEGQIVKRVPTGVLNDRCTEYVDFTLRIAGVGADAYKNTEYMCVAYTIYKDDATGELTTYYADACTRSYQGVVDALN